MSSAKYECKFINDDRLRNKYITEGRLNTFLKTYKIQNNPKNRINTTKFWNFKYLHDQQEIINSPIYIDKINIVSKYLRNKRGKILDIGIGNGFLETKLIKNINLALYGIDISTLAIKNAKNKFIGNFKKASILKIPYKNNYFDLNVALDILEHIPACDTFNALNELNRVLKKGGTLILSIPLNEHLEKKLKKGSNPNAHLREYSQSIMNAELETSGFYIIKKFLLYGYKRHYKIKKLLTRILPYLKKEANLYIVFAIKK